MIDEIGLREGDMLGKYQIYDVLGSGAMGVVYRALHTTLQSYVAVKVLPLSLTQSNPDLAERFLREAQIMARIRDPNVVSVIDVDQDPASGLCYIVLEYVAGGTLGDAIGRAKKGGEGGKAIAESHILRIGADIAHALIVANENHVVHRDIKPDNIMLDGRGRAKLSDLGLAKISNAGAMSLTQNNAFMGTPAYMSPEQASDAKTSDTRDDIYSLGATLYHALTLNLPYDLETHYNIIAALIKKPTPNPRSLRPDISDATTAVVMKMMAKTREDRYQTAQDLLQDLELAHHNLQHAGGTAQGLAAEPFLYGKGDLPDISADRARRSGIELPPRTPVPPPTSSITPVAPQSTAAGFAPATVKMSKTAAARQPASRQCAVLFLDIVGYSKLDLEPQYAVKRIFNDYLDYSLTKAAEEKGILEYITEGDKQTRVDADQRIILDTGDGAAVCFMQDHEEALIAALIFQRSILALCHQSNYDIAVRLGIHSGPVKLIEDIHGKKNPIGNGINTAQRIMSFSAGNQLCISRNYYENVACVAEYYRKCCRYLGARLDKHEMEHVLYEYRDTELEPYLPEPLPVLEEKAKIIKPATPTPKAPEVLDIEAERVPTTLSLPNAEQQQPGTATEIFSDFAKSVAPDQAFAPSRPPSSIPPGWNPELLSTLEKQLAKYVGPVARALVKKAAASNATLTGLIEALAMEITKPEDRQRFQRDTSLPSTIAPSASVTSLNARGGLTSLSASQQRIVLPGAPSTSVPPQPNRSRVELPLVNAPAAAPAQPTFVAPPRPPAPQPAPQQSIAPAPAEPQRPASSVIPATPSFTQEELEIVSGRLAKIVGPIAKVLVKRASARTNSIDELIEALLPEIPNEHDRQKFVSSLYQQ
ncbi:hypothetical protein DB346_02575 [Verrucomicrobia bacterium LW23]|nr:hypothetical protein DB346_04080 [Verrucomicrobia bacterium LW23]PTY04333.1 hypothetical protein DB346_02575 [Verrucomicrobia bacterium LW23]